MKYLRSLAALILLCAVAQCPAQVAKGRQDAPPVSALPQRVQLIRAQVQDQSESKDGSLVAVPALFLVGTERGTPGLFIVMVLSICGAINDWPGAPHLPQLADVGL